MNKLVILHLNIDTIVCKHFLHSISIEKAGTVEKQGKFILPNS